MYTDFSFSGNGFDMVTGAVSSYTSEVDFYTCVTVDGLSYLCRIEKEKGKRRKMTTSVEQYDNETKKVHGAKVYSYDVIRRLKDVTIAKYEIYMRLNKPF